MGGSLVAAGTRMTWVTATVRGSTASLPGVPPVEFGGGVFPYDGASVGAGYLFGLGLLLALVPLGWLVAGPRGRVILGIAGLGLSIGIGAAVASTRGDLIPTARAIVQREVSEADTRIATGPGVGVTAAGAALSGLASIVGAVAGGRIPPLRMPERAEGGGR